MARRLHYCVVGILGFVSIWVVVVTVLAQRDKAELKGIEPQPVIKELPAEFQADFQRSQDEIAKLQAQLSAATLRAQNILYQAALELGMTAKETRTCQIQTVSKPPTNTPVWSFVCPPEPPAPTTPQKQ